MLMIAQKILFAVRVVGCLVCDISGLNVECVNIGYVFTGKLKPMFLREVAGSWKILAINPQGRLLKTANPDADTVFNSFRAKDFCRRNPCCL
jgi:hypothetical protein